MFATKIFQLEKFLMLYISRTNFMDEVDIPFEANMEGKWYRQGITSEENKGDWSCWPTSMFPNFSSSLFRHYCDWWNYFNMKNKQITVITKLMIKPFVNEMATEVIIVVSNVLGKVHNLATQDLQEWASQGCCWQSTKMIRLEFPILQ